MKRLVNIYKFLPLIAMAIIVGCTSDDDSDLGITITPTRDEIVTESFSTATTIDNEVVDSSQPITVGGYITFADTSVDEGSRTWSIEDGTCFLVADFDPTLELSDQIDTEKGTSSDELQESIYFATPGYSTVTLLSKFSQNVGYENDDVTAIYYGGNWEVTTKFNVPVFAAELSPVLRISSGVNSVEFSTEELESQTSKSLDVGRGDDVIFEDLTEEEGFSAEELEALGSSLNRTWSYEGGLESFDDATTALSAMVFNTEIGTSHTGFGVEVSRKEPIDITTGALTIPLTINIVAAQIEVLSLEVSSVFESGATNQIIMSLDKAMAAPATCAGFTVAVTNEKATVSTITVTDATVDAEDNTKIILTLSDRLYSDDTITLAYDGTDGMLSNNGYAEVSSFIATEVANNIGSVLDPDMFGCEDFDLGTKLSTSGVTWWAASTFNSYITYAEDPTNSENQVLMVTMPETNTTTFMINNIAATAPSIPAGSYQIRYKLYVDGQTAGAISDCLHEVQYKSTEVTYTTIVEQTYPSDYDEWVTISGDVEFTTDLTTVQFKVAFSKTTYTDYQADAVIYFDDF